MSRGKQIETPEEFDALVDEYVSKCVADERMITLTGMILHLGLSSRQSLDRYKTYDGFSDSVKRLKLLVENAYEERLAKNNPTGSIFALKNMGWSDRQELDHSSTDGSMSGVDRVQIEVVGADANESEDSSD
jgi:hypothetical protein